MTTTLRLGVLSTDGVERAGPKEPPVAFRIWKAGENITDHGPTLFSERSASLLLDEQARRGNRYSFDVNHLALDKNAPLESQRAVGWFDIEVRNGELWAVNCEFSDFVRDGLTKDPPEWKYFSPAYQQDIETSEVTSLANIAVTNLPATWRVTALASQTANQAMHVNASREANKEGTRMSAKSNTNMKWGDIKAALDGDDEDKKASAYAAIKAAFPDKEPEGDEGEKKKEDGEGEPEKKDAEEEPEKKDSKASEEEPEKKDSTVAAALAEVNRLSAKVRELEKKNEADERRTLLASRPDFAPELVKILAKAPMAMVREHVAMLPKTATATRSTETVQATRSGDNGAANRLAPEASQALAERMGLRKSTAAIGWDPNMKTTRVFPVLAGTTAVKKEA